MKKSTLITVRLPPPTRRRLQALARREGRSLSQQVERLIEQGMRAREGTEEAPPPGPALPLSGRLRDGVAPTRADFRAIRTLLSTAFLRRTAARGHVRR